MWQLFKYSPSLPTNVFNLLSHKSAALGPFATRAKKAFFTFESIYHTDWGFINRKQRQTTKKKRWDWMSSYLKLGIKNDQFTADWNGIVTAVAFHEIHVDCGVSLWEHIGYIISIPPYSHVQACTDKTAEHNTKRLTFFVYFLLLSLVWHLQDSGAKVSAWCFQGLKGFAGSS